MPNDIKKLRRLMRTAHVLQKGDEDHKYGQSLALKQAWWFESFRGSTRTALGTRSPLLISADKAPKCPQVNDEWVESAKAIPYFDLEKKEWRSFSVLNFNSLDQVWKFNDPIAKESNKNR